MEGLGEADMVAGDWTAADGGQPVAPEAAKRRWRRLDGRAVRVENPNRHPFIGGGGAGPDGPSAPRPARGAHPPFAWFSRQAGLRARLAGAAHWAACCPFFFFFFAVIFISSIS